MTTDFLFFSSAPGADLLFGAQSLTTDATVEITGSFPSLSAEVELDQSPTVTVAAQFPQLTGTVTIIKGREVSIGAQFSPLTGSITAIKGRELTLEGQFPQFTGSMRVARNYDADVQGQFPQLTGSLFVVEVETITIQGSFPVMVSAQVNYNPQVARPTVSHAQGSWQVGTATSSGMDIKAQEATKMPVGWSTEIEGGLPCVQWIEHRLPKVFIPGRDNFEMWMQDGTGLGATITSRTQEADRQVRLSDMSKFQDASPLRYSAMQRFQDGGHGSRAWRKVQYQEASQHKGRMYTGSPKSGTAFSFARNTRFQEARVPPPGISKVVVPVVPPVKVSADLLFSALWDGSAHLVFGDSSSDGGQTVTLFILPARFYMVVHTLIAHRLPDLVEVPLFDASVASDMGSFCWSLQASGPKSLFSLLQPENNLPVQLRVTLDGIPFVFAVDSLSRSNAFGKTVASISGRSVTALIGEPYWRAGIYSNTEDRTAQQLAMDALVNTGIDLDWGIGDGVGANGGLVDWLVPAGALSHQGSPLSVVQRIAQAAGGYLQSHRSTTTLLTRHPYGARSGDVSGAPWDWYAGAADVELAADAVITDAVSRVDGADINAVYVSGTTQGVNGFVKRAGSAADKLAPMVSDALITDVVAARQRGLAILGAAGHKHTVRVELPVLTGVNQPGILDVGQLVQVNAVTPWRGRVRAVSVASKWPSMRQSVTLERHLEVA